MNILTLGTSPYLLLRNGRVHADILRHLAANGHTPTCLAVAHDTAYYLADVEGNHTYEEDGKRICLLCPFIAQREQNDIIFDAMKKTQPEVFLSIGNCEETAGLHPVKAMYPSFFKWIAILTIESEEISDAFRVQLQYLDHAVVLNEKARKTLQKVYDGDITVIPFGPSASFHDTNERTGTPFTALCSARNLQVTNIPAFIRAIGGLNGTVLGRLHSNFYDIGEVDYSLLMERYEAKDYLTLTEVFTSMKEGLSAQEMNSMYSHAHAIVDCSTCSAVGLTMLEAMVTGAVPIGTDYGAIGSILGKMPEEFRFAVPYEILVGKTGEEFAIISTKYLQDYLGKVRNMYLQRPDAYRAASEAAKQVARTFLKEDFSNCLQLLIETVAQKGDVLVLKQYT